MTQASVHTIVSEALSIEICTLLSQSYGVIVCFRKARCIGALTDVSKAFEWAEISGSG